MTDFSGKVALVTGAGRGLGADYARFFADDGATVVVADVDPATAEATAGALVAAGAEAIGVAVDVADPAGVRAMVDHVVDRLGRLDILVNNAGIWGDLMGTHESILETDPDYWDFVMGVNLKGAWLCSAAAVPVMLANGWGRIVNISSIGSRMAGGVYGVSKLALNQLTYSISAAVGDHGVTCNAVAPGAIWNEATQRQVPAEMFDHLIMPLHVKRPGTSRDLYGAIRWLCSDDAAWHTGQVVYVNGGFFSTF